MGKNYSSIFILIILVIALSCVSKQSKENETYVSYEVDLKTKHLKMYWKDDNQQVFKTLGNIKSWLDSNEQQLVFAMNGGMYKEGNIPQGLFIQDHQIIVPLDTLTSSGNFYLKPNGVFYVSSGQEAIVCTTEEFRFTKDISYATQSGPMLVINGKIHPAFNENSRNLNIGNGVGILPSGKALFAISKKEVSLYDFASFFKNSGCKNALYLDGFVSRAYLPEQDWVQTDGDFGVIIAVTTKK